MTQHDGSEFFLLTEMSTVGNLFNRDFLPGSSQSILRRRNARHPLILLLHDICGKAKPIKQGGTCWTKICRILPMLTQNFSSGIRTQARDFPLKAFRSKVRKTKQERDPFTDLRRLCVTNLVSFLDTAIVEKMFLPYTPFRKSFPFSHLFFD